MLRWFFTAGLITALSACTTVPKPPKSEEPVATGPSFPNPDVENPGVIIIAEPRPEPKPAPEVTAPPPPTTQPPEVEIIETPKWYDQLNYWARV